MSTKDWNVVYLILVILAGVCFIVAARNRAVGSLQPVALGLALWVTVYVIQFARVLH